MTTHELKCWPEYFGPLADGRKTFEVRLDDRGFAVGDVLWFREYILETGLTGRDVRKRVTYVLSGMGLEAGFVCMGLADCTRWRPYLPREQCYWAEDDCAPD